MVNIYACELSRGKTQAKQNHQFTAFVFLRRFWRRDKI